MDPFVFFNSIYPYSNKNIKVIYSGSIYTIVELLNGQIGLCANLNHKISTQIPNVIDFSKTEHRIIAQAYYNAHFNYTHISNLLNKDIVDIILEKKYNTIVMIGLFKPILKKLQECNISLSVFDFMKDEPFIINYNDRKNYIQNADCIILSATTIFNKTFLEIINDSSDNCDIHVIGPSTPLAEQLFTYKNIKYLHGIIPKEKQKIIQVVSNNQGTRKFIKFCEKVDVKP